jgi:chromosome segregation ATPase
VILGIKPRDQDLAAKSLATLKNELAEEKVAREKAQTDVETLTWAVEELKKTVNQFTTQIPSLETQVKNLNDKIVNLNVELHAREVSLEWMTDARDGFQRQTTRLMKKLEGKDTFCLVTPTFCKNKKFLCKLECI